MLFAMAGSAPPVVPAMAPAPSMQPSPPARPLRTPAELHPVEPVEPEERMAAGSFVENLRAERAERDERMDPVAAPRGGNTLTSAIVELVSAGLSDRAIARQLHIGLEEVRMARVRVGR